MRTIFPLWGNVKKPTGSDEKVKYDANDQTSGYLSEKVVAGANIVLSEGTGADENKLKIAVTGLVLKVDNGQATANVVYGFLYNWYAANDSRNIAASGWHLPTNSEWITLNTYVGGTTIAGGKLKETGTTHWYTPNTGATNEFGFNARGAGIRAVSGSFGSLTTFGHLWTATEFGNYGYIMPFNHDTAASATNSVQDKWYGNSIRLIKDDSTLEPYIGNDGKIYDTVKIGNQVWMSVNLMETKYRNGNPIPEETSNSTWVTLLTGARCSFDNNTSNAGTSTPVVTEIQLSTSLNNIHNYLALIQGGTSTERYHLSLAELLKLQNNEMVSDTAYNANSWDGVGNIAPSKNAVRDKIESIMTLFSSYSLGGWFEFVSNSITSITQGFLIGWASSARTNFMFEFVLRDNNDAVVSKGVYHGTYSNNTTPKGELTSIIAFSSAYVTAIELTTSSSYIAINFTFSSLPSGYKLKGSYTKTG